jgi:NAD(P)-dependent dehydrogenase (short-subunit alcohol dehydrogenase family)
VEAVMREQARAAGITYDQFRVQATELTPLRRLIPPEDVAATAVFLASDASASTTGEDVNVSGGLAMH